MVQNARLLLFCRKKLHRVLVTGSPHSIAIRQYYILGLSSELEAAEGASSTSNLLTAASLALRASELAIRYRMKKMTDAMIRATAATQPMTTPAMPPLDRPLFLPLSTSVASATWDATSDADRESDVELSLPELVKVTLTLGSVEILGSSSVTLKQGMDSVKASTATKITSAQA